MEQIFKIAQGLGILIGVAFFSYQFYLKVKLEKDNMLSQLWRKFYENESFTKLFSILEEIELGRRNSSDLAIYDTQIKLKYLAYLSEVLIYVDSGSNFIAINSIDKNKAMRYFKFLFTYVYINESTRDYFWANLVENNDNQSLTEIVTKEIEQDYWKYQLEFARNCENSI